MTNLTRQESNDNLKSAAVTATRILGAYPNLKLDVELWAREAIVVIAKLSAFKHEKLARLIIDNHKFPPSVAEISAGVRLLNDNRSGGELMPMPDDTPAEVFWRDCLVYMANYYGAVKINHWFQGVRVAEYSPGELCIRVGVMKNRQDRRSHLINNYWGSINRAACFIEGGPVKLRII